MLIRLAPRALRPLTLLAPFAAAFAALALLPGLSVRPAEGCSGSSNSPDCGEAPAWRSFEVLTKQAPVPTDAGVLLRVVTSPASCPGAPQPEQLRAAAVAGAQRVEGVVSVVDTFNPTSSPGSSLYRESTYTLLWKPAQALDANAAYVLAIDAPSPGGAGSGGAGGVGGSSGEAGGAGQGGGQGTLASLPFTTAGAGLGELAPPAAVSVTTAPVRVTTARVCCASSGAAGCGASAQECLDALDQEWPELTLSFAPSAAEPARPYLDYQIFELANGGPPSSIGTTPGRLETSFPFSYKKVLYDGERTCFQVKTLNLVTGATLVTDLPCPEPVAVDPAVVARCADVDRAVAACAAEGGRINVFGYGEGAAALQTACPNSLPPPGAPGASGASGASGSGGGPASPSQPPGGPSDNDGCQLRPGAPGPRPFAFAGLVASLGALISRRRRARRSPG